MTCTPSGWNTGLRKVLLINCTGSSVADALHQWELKNRVQRWENFLIYCMTVRANYSKENSELSDLDATAKVTVQAEHNTVCTKSGAHNIKELIQPFKLSPHDFSPCMLKYSSRGNNMTHVPPPNLISKFNNHSRGINNCLRMTEI